MKVFRVIFSILVFSLILIFSFLYSFFEFESLHYHKFSNITKDSSCTESGGVFQECICGFTYIEVEIPQKEHIFENWNVDVNTLKGGKGIEKRICNICLFEEVRDFVCTHNDLIDEVVIKKTCTSTGLSQKRCVLCDEVIEETVVNKLTHKYGQWVVLTNSSPIKDGLRFRNCVYCNNLEEQVFKFNKKGSNFVYIESANINAKFVIGPFSQFAVDNNDVVYNIERIDCKNPIILGHNTGSLKYLYKTKVGTTIYVYLNNVLTIYTVVSSEPAVTIPKDIEGLNTGRRLCSYFDTDCLRLYTCYKDVNLGEIRWLVIAEKFGN